MKKTYNRDLCIIAGGKSSRMGADKGLLPFYGSTMTGEIIRNIGGLFENVFISANNPDYKQFSLPVYRDKYENKGPVSAIHTALTYSANEWVMVCRCDMPFVDKSVVKSLFGAKTDIRQGVIASQGGKIYPVVGLYHKSALETVENHINSDSRKLLNILADLNTIYVEFSDDDKLRNINTPEEYSEVKGS